MVLAILECLVIILHKYEQFSVIHVKHVNNIFVLCQTFVLYMKTKLNVWENMQSM